MQCTPTPFTYSVNNLLNHIPLLSIISVVKVMCLVGSSEALSAYELHGGGSSVLSNFKISLTLVKEGCEHLILSLELKVHF